MNLEEKDGEFFITGSRLKLNATVPGMGPQQFKQSAIKVKDGCPISKLLDTKITLEALLEE